MATVALDDGSFKLRLSEGENRVLVSRLPPDLIVKSIMFGEIDATKTPLNINASTLSKEMIVTLEAVAPESLPAVSAKASLTP